jgi:cytosine/adenosine deaminase-related metal-dependent hydrolase
MAPAKPPQSFPPNAGPPGNLSAGNQLIRATWLAPMSADRPGELIPGGGVLVRDGKIIGVGSGDSLRAQAHYVTEMPGHLLLPGLVNAHTHLELSLSQPGNPPKNFAAWLTQMIRSAENDSAAAVAHGVDQCWRFGVTTVADITRQPGLVRPYLAVTGLRITSFGEVRAMATRRHQLAPLLDAALHAGVSPQGRPRIGISPHSPYSTESAAYLACIEAAKKFALPLTTHLAESPDEAQFLAHHTGPLRDLWDSLGWDDQVPKFAGGPIRFAKSLSLLDLPTLLAHVNYCDDAELAILAAGRASVVYCPRTHRFFGHPPHRFQEMLARGINVAVGTDSCASSPDLNLLNDLRLIHQIAPDMPAASVLEMGTRRGAAALGLENLCGSVAPGRAADLVAFAVTAANNPLLSLLESDALPTKLFSSHH